MDELMKLVMEKEGLNSLSIDEIAKQLYQMYSECDSEIDKWYKTGEDFWLKRTTASNYLSVQVFPLLEDSYLCYLHALNIGNYDKKSIEEYKRNVELIPADLPIDIRYIYPIAISQDTEKANEMFLASSLELKNEWLNKLGIRHV